MAVEPSLLEWAEYWYPISWKGVLTGGVITAIGAVATIAFLLLQWRTTTIREQQSDWRTTVLEAETAKAEQETEKSREHIAQLYTQAEVLRKQTAEAKAQTAQTEERMARLSMPRGLFLSGVDTKRAFAGHPPMKVEIFWLRSVSDGQWLASRIASCLAEKDGMPDTDIVTNIGAVDNLPKEADRTGVTVVGRPGRGGAWWVEPKSPQDFVMKALSTGMTGDPSGVTLSYSLELADDQIQIFVGPKL